MKKSIFLYFEQILFKPKNLIDKIFVYLLSPFSFLYCILTFLNSYKKHLFRYKYPLKIIGVGNLILGGSGKTPLIIALAKREKNIAVVLRGYGRVSKGVLVISDRGKILTSVLDSGDEAMLYAKKIQNCSVIVSENRYFGILKAQELGAETIFLDDSYRQHQIEKFKEYIIISKTENNFCIPAGGYREKLWFFKKNILLIEEGKDFFRKIYIDSPTENMVLITAISKSYRLNRYIPKDIPKYIFPDHYSFTETEIERIYKKEKATSILTTEKDFVKMDSFQFNFSIIKLEIKLSSNFN